MSSTATPRIEAYFQTIDAQIKEAHVLCEQARAKGHDPEPRVEIKLAKNMAERVIGLISVLCPKLVGSGADTRITELEQQYGPLDWRVALTIALEIAQQKFCTFNDPLEAISIGIRTGFAYITLGSVSSPLDGIVKLELKDRNDRQGKYLSMSFAGPVRNAGGTAAGVSVVIADYVRKNLGVAAYDATPGETRRAYVELQDYHDRVTNLQYFPSEKEVSYLVSKLPVEVAGEPSEDFEVSSCKDLPRIPTNKIRSGYCLLLSSCIPLKAPKLWKNLGTWGKDFGLDQTWGFLEEFLKIQKSAKAGSAASASTTAPGTPAGPKVLPDNTYLADLVAGRPVLGFPLRPGAFRLRYGRSRASGLMTQCIHPATMVVLDDYIATGTQLKTERPNKSAAFTPCDLIDGPIVKLDDESVLHLTSESQARALNKRVSEILFLGDQLVDLGDFDAANAMLCPVAYVPEWWIKEVEKAAVTQQGVLDPAKLAELIDLPPERVATLLNNPLTVHPTLNEALLISQRLNVPLHPTYTVHWKDISRHDFDRLTTWLDSAQYTNTGDHITKIVLPYQTDKRTLELLGVTHSAPQRQFVVIDGNDAAAFALNLNLTVRGIPHDKLDPYLTEHPDASTFDIVKHLCPVPLKDVSGTYIGSRMGRPEKAKLRTLAGTPNGLFPIGEEGGRMRSLQAALETGKVTANYCLLFCKTCNQRSISPTCPTCHQPCTQQYYCRFCDTILSEPTCSKHGPAATHKRLEMAIRPLFESTLKHLDMKTHPDLIKGVKGTIGVDHIPEPLAKAILRAKYDLAVNKDGTVRYDCSEITLTHFKPKEVRTSIERLRQLGYTHDIHGKEITDPDQICEILPQDVVLPSCPSAGHETADDAVIRTSKFVDDLLTKLYKLPPYYNIKTADDCIGHLLIALAPHTSAGLAVRIIGFSKTQGFLAHPYVHQACRRDCDGDEIGFILLLDGFLNFSRRYLPDTRGSAMDAPLVLTSQLIPTEIDEQCFTLGITPSYPLEVYEAAAECKMPRDIKIKQIKHILAKPEQYENHWFTHDNTDINSGVVCSAYKTLPSMEEKLKGQMELAMKIRAVEASDVARLVIEKHFVKDAKGNLRQFSEQSFRCVNCNEKYRRPPLIGRCTACPNGKIVFTVSEGGVVKYLEPMISLAKRYNLSPYLQQNIELIRRRIEAVFGKEKERQTGLGAWFG